MGKRGPKPKPTAQLRLAGSRLGKERSPDEAKFVHEPPVPPEGLCTPAAREWFDRLVEQCSRVPGLLAATDGLGLAMLANAIVQYTDACQTLVGLESPYYTSDKGNWMAHPALHARDRAWAQVLKGCALFGLSAADRASLKIGGPPEPADTKADYFKQRPGRGAAGGA